MGEEVFFFHSLSLYFSFLYFTGKQNLILKSHLSGCLKGLRESKIYKSYFELSLLP